MMIDINSIETNPMKQNLSMSQARHMLMYWYEYEHDLNTSSKDRLLEIKTFFYRLSYLNINEREFLAYIYYHENKKDSPNSEQIKKRFDLNSKEHVTNKKNEIISKLLAPVLEPCKQDNNKQANISNDDAGMFKSTIIEQLFNELLKMHS